MSEQIMTSRDFCYWLQGYFELQGPGPLSQEQVAVVSAHLSMVFKHEIDPSFGNEERQAVLDRLHKMEQKVHSHDRELDSGRLVRC